MRTLLVPQGHVHRRAIEGLIRDIYALEYGATISGFPPLLFAMIDDDGRPVCATGLRFSSDGFFSECYLNAPIEQVLKNRTGLSADRDDIFEVSTLVSRTPRLAGRFLVQIAKFGESAGFDWAFFTATGHLQGLLKRLSLPLMEIASADRQRVIEPDRWGTYYDTSPRVYAVHHGGFAAFVQTPIVARVAYA